MFRFRLQQVLDLREKQERELATQLVQALYAEENARLELDELQASRNASAEQSAGTGPRAVGELANLAFVLQQLDGYIATAHDAVNAAGENVTNVKDALTSAFQDRHVLDRLRERHKEDYQTSAEQLDRRTMDDIALTRYTQNDT